MYRPEHVLRQIRTRYENNWRDWLLSPPDSVSFPLAAPDAETIAREAREVGAWKKEWVAWQAERAALGLRTAQKRTTLGPQEIFTHLDVATVDDLVSIDEEMQRHWHTASARWAQIRQEGGHSAEKTHGRMRRSLPALVSLDPADFTILLRAAAWFREFPASGLTVRQVPVLGMHTKWLKRHRQLVLALLGVDAIPEAADELTEDDLEQSDLDALGLRALPVQVDVIIADRIAQQQLGGLRSVRAPLPEIASLPITPRAVVVVENKESALLVPDRDGVAVIHSLGNHLNVLAEIPWARGADIFYWGDLDRAGFTLLSRARSRLPATQSILMDEEALARYVVLCTVDKTKADPPDPNLTGAEVRTLSSLKTSVEGEHLRLEQERLPADYVRHHLQMAIGGDDQQG